MVKAKVSMLAASGSNLLVLTKTLLKRLNQNLRE